MRIVRHKPTLVGVAWVLGLLLAVAFNTSTRPAGSRPGRAADLAGVVRTMEQRRSDLQSRLADLRSRVADLDRRSATDAGMRDSYARELERARADAGLTEVVGSGLVVTLSDAKVVPFNEDPNDCLIHDFDVSAVVNALLSGGAHAVAVNSKRITATTPIRCAGTTILVDSTRLGGPYAISAVGSADVLERGLLDDDAAGMLFRVYPSRYGIGADIERRSQVRVPAYSGSLQPTYAERIGSER